MRHLLALLLVFGTGISLPAAIAVAHPQVVVTELTPERLRAIVYGRSSTWPDGRAVVLILVDDPAASAALEELCGMSLPRLMRGWKRLVFAGGGAMPIIVSNPAAAFAQVRRSPGALTILPEDGTVPDDLHVIHRPSTD